MTPKLYFSEFFYFHWPKFLQLYIFLSSSEDSDDFIVFCAFIVPDWVYDVEASGVIGTSRISVLSGCKDWSRSFIFSYWSYYNLLTI